MPTTTYAACQNRITVIPSYRYVDVRPASFWAENILVERRPVSLLEVLTVTNEQLLARRNRLLGKDAPLFYDKPLHIVRGEGVWLYDNEGKRYLDAYNNVPVVGHCHPKVVEALHRQASMLNIHTRYLHEAVVEYADRLTSTFDSSLDMAVFTCTGSEANELALRMARFITGAKGIICSDCTYHGNTAAVDELSTMLRDGKTGGPNVSAVPFPDMYRPLDGLSGDALIDAYVGKVEQRIFEFKEAGIGFAGMLICPIFANEGVPNFPNDYLKRVAKVVRESGGILIFDEVQSGFGRTGQMWAQDLIGVVPDLVTLGKPMGNGHPIGAVVGGSEIVNAFRAQAMYFNTFGGNPVSSVVGLAVLDAIESDGLLENVNKVGAELHTGFASLQSRFECIGDVRSRGLFFGIDIVKDRTSKEPDGHLTKELVNAMKDNGILISRVGAHNSVLKVRPPLPFDSQNASHLIEVLTHALSILQD